MTDTFRAHSGFPYHAGMRMIESEHATSSPPGKPYTDDMRDMIEHMADLGLIQRVPAAFVMHDGKTMMIHPAMAAKLRARLREISRQIENSIFKVSSAYSEAAETARQATVSYGGLLEKLRGLKRRGLL